MPEEKNNKFCFNCGAEIDVKAEICPKCGVRQQSPTEKVSNWWYLLAFLFSIIGGVIAWAVNKDRDPKKARRFIIVGFIFPLIWVAISLIIIPLSLGGAREKARDARRESDIRQISLAMEMFYDMGENGEYGEYLQSAIMPNAIGTFLNPIPQDPGNGPCSSYKWISNFSDSKRFCVYACLSDGTFVVANQKGTHPLNRAPTDLDCL